MRWCYSLNVLLISRSQAALSLALISQVLLPNPRVSQKHEYLMGSMSLEGQKKSGCIQTRSSNLVWMHLAKHCGVVHLWECDNKDNMIHCQEAKKCGWSQSERLLLDVHLHEWLLRCDTGLQQVNVQPISTFLLFLKLYSFLCIYCCSRDSCKQMVRSL